MVKLCRSKNYMPAGGGEAVVVWESGPFAALKSALDSGTYLTKFPIGTEIDDVWVNTTNDTPYNIPLVIMDYQMVTLEDGSKKMGAILMRKYLFTVSYQFDAAEPKNANTQIQTNGYNKYSESGIHKWLNADGIRGEWWYPSTTTDVQPTFAPARDGYLRGCSEDLLKYIKPVQIKTKTNSVTDGGVVDVTIAKFFLPSVEEMYGDPTANNGAGAGVEVFERYWSYVKTATGMSAPSNTTNSERAIKDTTGPTRNCWLRSSSTGSASSVWYINPNGQLTSQSATSTNYVAPACVIA